MEEAVRSTGKRSAEPTNSPPFVEVLKKFQKLNNLPTTGRLDDATINAMNKPRCGVPDNQVSKPSQEKPSFPRTPNKGTMPSQGADAPKTRRKRFLDLLMNSEKNRKEQEAFQNSGGRVFNKKLLKWRMIGEGYSSQLSINEQRYVFRLAFRMWSEVMPVDFEEDNTSPLSQIDIKLGFGRGMYIIFFLGDLTALGLLLCNILHLMSISDLKHHLGAFQIVLSASLSSRCLRLAINWLIIYENS